MKNQDNKPVDVIGIKIEELKALIEADNKENVIILRLVEKVDEEGDAGLMSHFFIDGKLSNFRIGIKNIMDSNKEETKEIFNAFKIDLIEKLLNSIKE